MRKWGIVALGVALGGCASSSEDIMPAYVSPVAYQTYTCQQLALKAQSISKSRNPFRRSRRPAHRRPMVNRGSSGVIFWPAAFFVGGDRQTAAELAQMKGQMVAVEQASIAKNCGIQFQGQRRPST